MSDVYAIKESTLTALGDAVRNKTGKETKIITVIEKAPAMIVSKTPNATGFTTYEGDAPASSFFDVVSLPQAVKIKVKIGWQAMGLGSLVKIGEGSASNDTEFNQLSNIKRYEGSLSTNDFKYEENIYNSNTITFSYGGFNTPDYVDLGYYAECIALDENGDEVPGDTEIEVEKEVLNTMTPLQMVEEITNLPAAPTAEDLVITGIANYRFGEGGWEWLIKKYGNLITTKDISSATYMFDGNTTITEIPFDLNFDTSQKSHKCFYIFNNCYSLTTIPKINGLKPSDVSSMFMRCYNLRELDYESIKDIDWTYMENLTSSYDGYRSSTFGWCHSLRSFPMEFLNHNNPIINYSSSLYYGLFARCYALDEVIGLPVLTKVNWTGNAFSSAFEYCARLKNVTFALQEDGSPYVTSGWKKQTIDLSSGIGYVYFTKGDILNYNSGITEATQVKDDTTYQALKNNPDWWTLSPDYSRYNHDSAVTTINSLPDVSTSGAVNTIKFRGAAGAKTDGGAINTLTEEEIAVAAAKGWTVTFV